MANSYHIRRTLYVTNLDSSTTESDLYEHFKTAGGDIVSCVVNKSSQDNKLCLGRGLVGFRNRDDGQSVSGFVRFRNRDDVLNAITLFDSSMFKQKIIGVNFSPFHISIPEGLVFVTNLDVSLDEKDVYNLFSEYGNILSILMRARGYASIQYDCSEAAQNAIHQCHGRVIKDKKVDVSSSQTKNLKTDADDTAFNSICILLFSPHTTKQDLLNTFHVFGKIRCVYILDRVKNRFGVVNFQNPQDAARALDALKHNVLGDHLQYCCRSNSEVDPTLVLVDKFQGIKLHVKNLDDNINSDIRLKALFSRYGHIYSSEVLRNFTNGTSTRSGVVTFKNMKDASRARDEMDGKMILNKTLCVSLAEDESARLLDHDPAAKL